MILINVELPDGDVADATSQMLAILPRSKVVIITPRADDDALVRCVAAGCSGFVTEQDSVEALVASIHAAYDGEEVTPVSELAPLMRKLPPTQRGLGGSLRPREIEVLALVASGLPNKQIASRLGLSLNTVRNHVQSVLYKFTRTPNSKPSRRQFVRASSTIRARTLISGAERAIQTDSASIDVCCMGRYDARRSAGHQSMLLAEAQAIAHVGSWEWDVATGVLSWTAEHYRIFGLDPSTFSPNIDNAIAAIHEDDRDRLQLLLEVSIEHAQPFSTTVRIRRPSGEVRWIESVGVPSIGTGGGVKMMIGTALDVTEKEQSLARLQESEARHKMIVETAREGIWVVDAEGKTTFGNAQLASMLGRALDEIIGASVFDFLDEEGRAVAADNFAGLRQGIASRFDFGFVRPDGSEVWTLLSSAPILDADGRYSGALAMLTDITERHHADIALQQSEARLSEAQRLALMGNWTFDVKSRVLTCSDELFLVIGVEPDQGTASFERFILLVHPDDRVRAASFLTRVQVDFLAVSDEVRIVTPKGDDRWIALRARTNRRRDWAGGRDARNPAGHHRTQGLGTATGARRAPRHVDRVAQPLAVRGPAAAALS